MVRNFQYTAISALHQAGFQNFIAVHAVFKQYRFLSTPRMPGPQNHANAAISYLDKQSVLMLY